MIRVCDGLRIGVIEVLDTIYVTGAVSRSAMMMHTYFQSSLVERSLRIKWFTLF